MISEKSRILGFPFRLQSALSGILVAEAAAAAAATAVGLIPAAAVDVSVWLPSIFFHLIVTVVWMVWVEGPDKKYGLVDDLGQAENNGFGWGIWLINGWGTCQIDMVWVKGPDKKGLVQDLGQVLRNGFG